MTDYKFAQLIDIDLVRQLLESHQHLSGMAYTLFDNNENDIVSTGWQEICTRFHRVHPLCSARCCEIDAYIKSNLREIEDNYLECRCGNGMIEVAIPIIIEGRHLATFLIGQFFYDDDPPEREFFLNQAREFGFDPDGYLAALEQVPVYNHEQIRANLTFLHSMVQVLAESGLKNIRLANEMEQRKLFEERYAILCFALDHVCEAAYLIDGTRRFLYVNQEACCSLGYSRDELIGMTVPEIDPDYFSEMVLHCVERIREEGSHTFESRHRTKDGRTFPVEITSTLLEYEGERYSLALVRDITERKQMEELVYKREQEFRTMVENSPDYISRYDRECCRIYVNPALENLFGRQMEGVIGAGPTDMSPITETSELEQILRNVWESGKEFKSEGQFWTLTGEHRWCHIRVVPELGPDGKITNILSIGRDINDLKEAERRLQESHALMRLLLQTIPDLVWLKDFDGRYLLCNHAFEGFFHVSESDIASKTDYDFVAAEQANYWHEKDREAIKAAEPLIYEQWISPGGNGRSRLLEIRKVPMFSADHDLIGVLGIARDITERKRMEEQLRFSEQQFRTLAENSPGMIIRYDTDCRRVYVNPAYNRVTGIAVETALGVSTADPWMVGANLTPQEYTQLLRYVMETGDPVEILLEWPDSNTGRLSSHLFHIVAERGSDSNVNGCLAIDYDITRLRETELKLAKLAKTLPGVIYSFLMTPDCKTRMTYVSPRIEELFALDSEVMLKDMTSFFACIHPDDPLRVMQSLAVSARELSAWIIEFRVLHPIRGEVWVEGNSIPELQCDGNILWYGFLHDITERKRNEEALNIKRTQLAALSTELSLAEERERQNIAAMLHDHIGQTLLLISIKLGILANEITRESDIKIVEEARTLLGEVTHDIHNLTVQMNPPILAVAGLEAALEWLGRRMEEDYGLFVEFEDDMREKPLLDEVRSVVYQCGRELLINVAKHANTDHARIVVAREDDRYRLTIEDDGDGFDISRNAHNTFKDCRLGLISIQIRIERLGGNVVFESLPGTGSWMTILAPLAPDESTR